MDGKSQVILITPEKALDTAWMKRLLKYYKERCIAVAFDEAHLISEWYKVK